MTYLAVKRHEPRQISYISIISQETWDKEQSGKLKVPPSKIIKAFDSLEKAIKFGEAYNQFDEATHTFPRDISHNLLLTLNDKPKTLRWTKNIQWGKGTAPTLKK